MSGYTIAALVVIAIALFVAWRIVRAGDEFERTFEDRPE